MNKFGTLFLLSALFPFSSGAQTLIKSDILQKTSTVFTEQSDLSIPMRAELNSNQRLAGYYTSDNLAKSGLGVPKFGENEHCKAGIVLSSDMLAPFVGKKIVGVRFGVCAKMDKSRIFIAKDTNGVIGEDLVSKDVAAPVKGWNTMMFDTPLTIEAGQDLLAGYEFAQKTKKKGGYYSDVCFPLSIVKEGMKNKPVMIYFNYGDFGEGWHKVMNTGENLSIQVIIEGDFKDSSAMPFGFGTVVAGADATPAATVQMLNMGTAPLTEITYTVSVDGTKGEAQKFTFDTPVAANGYGTFSATLPTVSGYGRKNVKVDITEVDGSENMAETRVADGYIGKAKEFFPRNVLIEEFTTEKCGNCPRVAGYLHDMLKDADTERVFAVCHHSAFYTDWLTQQCDEDIYPLMFGGNGSSFAPAMMMNRSKDLFTDNPQGVVYIPSSKMEIDYYAKLIMEQQANSSLDIQVAASEDSRQAVVIVNGKCNEEFEVDKSRLTLYLTEDNIAAEDQSGAEGDYKHMHVIRYFNSSWGDKVVWNDNSTFTASYTIDINEGWNKNELKCVAFLSKLNDDDFSDNRIDNSACVDYLKAAAGVKGISEETQLKETARYSISGTRISSQQKGINIVRLSDGRTVKVVVR